MAAKISLVYAIADNQHVDNAALLHFCLQAWFSPDMSQIKIPVTILLSDILALANSADQDQTARSSLLRFYTLPFHLHFLTIFSANIVQKKNLHLERPTLCFLKICSISALEKKVNNFKYCSTSASAVL